MPKNSNNNNGFALVPVLLILAIISGITFTYFSNSENNSSLSKVDSSDNVLQASTGNSKLDITRYLFSNFFKVNSSAEFNRIGSGILVGQNQDFQNCNFYRRSSKFITLPYKNGGKSTLVDVFSNVTYHSISDNKISGKFIVIVPKYAAGFIPPVSSSISKKCNVFIAKQTSNEVTRAEIVKLLTNVTVPTQPKDNLITEANLRVSDNFYQPWYIFFNLKSKDNSASKNQMIYDIFKSQNIKIYYASGRVENNGTLNLTCLGTNCADGVSFQVSHPGTGSDPDRRIEKIELPTLNYNFEFFMTGPFRLRGEKNILLPGNQ